MVISMMVPCRQANGARRRTRGHWALAAGLVLTLAAAPSQASPIRSQARARRVAARQERRMERIDAYFARALATHRTAITIPAGATRLFGPQADGLLPDCAFWDYMRWRRSFVPARFDYYHRRIGKMLRWDELVRNCACNCPGTNPPAVSPETITPPPPTVPEPSGFVVGLVLLGAGAWGRSRTRRGGGGSNPAGTIC